MFLIDFLRSFHPTVFFSKQHAVEHMRTVVSHNPSSMTVKCVLKPSTKQGWGSLLLKNRRPIRIQIIIMMLGTVHYFGKFKNETIHIIYKLYPELLKYTRNLTFVFIVSHFRKLTMTIAFRIRPVFVLTEKFSETIVVEKIKIEQQTVLYTARKQYQRKCPNHKYRIASHF